MLFIPYNDESLRIEKLKKFIGTNYSVIRLTDTMINKNNIDANYFLRALLKRKDVVDYDKLQNGGKYGKLLPADIYSKGKHIRTKVKLYKVKGKRSDPRFSIYRIKKLSLQYIIGTGDLLVIFPYLVNQGKQLRIFIFNSSYDLPNDTALSKLFDIDSTHKKLAHILSVVHIIAKEGYHSNSKGEGKVSPKDAGDTLESLLGVQTNNRQNADIDGLIELKTKSMSGLDTLFTLRPRFDDTPVAKVEPHDRSRVSAYTRMYGYFSEKHPDAKSLYVTIGSSPNNQGLYLKVNEAAAVVELRKESQVTAFWKFEDLEHELKIKHPTTLWFDVDIDKSTKTAKFLYKAVRITQIPSFETFIKLISSGIITYDWRGYTTITGKYKGKNHGNAWRINKKNLSLLFGDIKYIDLQK